MKFDYILTFDTAPQEFGEGEITPFFRSADVAVGYFKGLTAGRTSPLVKVSICAHTASAKSLPSWYLKANGKLWSEDLGT